MGKLVLGVDPGARETGLVVMRDGHLLGHSVVKRMAAEQRIAYLQRVIETAEALVPTIIDGLPVGAVVGMEDMTRPTGFHHGRKHPIDPTYVMEASAVLGAVAAWAILRSLPVVIVVAGRNGQNDLRTYPAALISSRTSKGTGDLLRHARSAWDVAQGAVRLARTAEAVAKAGAR